MRFPAIDIFRLRERGFLASHALLAHLAASAILVTGICHMWEGRGLALAEATGGMRNLGHSLAQHATRSIEAVDLALREVVDAVESGALGEPEALQRSLERSGTGLAQIRSLVVTDHDGTWIAASPRSALGWSGSADRRYLLRHREEPDREIHLDPPLRSRVSRKLLIPVTRSWRRPDGGFGGVVLASLAPEHFERFYGGLALGEGGSVALLDPEGRPLVGAPPWAGSVGDAPTQEDLLRTHLPRAASGVVRSRAARDGTELLVAYERLDGQPVVVAVTRSLPEILAGWRRAVITEAAAIALAVVLLGTLGIALDRHHRRAAEAERAVRTSEARYRLLSENGSDMIVQADLDTTRRYVSPACRELLGYEPEELVGTKPLADIHPDDRAAGAEILARLAAGEVETATSCQRYRRRDGSHVWVDARLRLLRDAGGAPCGYVAALRDVSERQHQAAALEQARDAAERASRAKTDFLATMSHEIFTPLTSILGYTDLLLEDPTLGERHRRQGERIRAAGTALLTIASDLLDLSTIEAGELTLDPQPFRLAGLVETAVAIVDASAQAKGIALHARVAPSLAAVTVVGDEDRLRQVLLNLLGNAVKFTNAGSVTLTLSEGPVREKRRALHVAVTDTGIGIPAEQHGRLFQRFSQADGSIRRTFGGSGLGLAIAGNLVERMGGRIGVESRPGLGSTFWFSVTLAEAEPDPRSPEPPPHDPDAFASMVGLLGRDRVDGLLDLLAAELRRGFQAPAADRDRLRRNARAVVSTASLLGFAALAALCREIEEAGRAGAVPEELRDRIAPIRQAALADLLRLRGARHAHALETAVDA
ncbi:ATP-binding protein [Methylobacterium sp. ID0610]|uniref:ATP-binding protein n=1 Tax=Methylobacterium carpenticola TaxID=3344827 RepID=UPI0036B693C0